MSDTSATTPHPDRIRAWASEWADVYAQDYDESKLSKLVGQHVKAYAEVAGESKGFTGWIVGYSIDTLRIPLEEDEVPGDDWEGTAHRYSLLTDEGLQCPIFAGMEIEEVEVE